MLMRLVNEDGSPFAVNCDIHRFQINCRGPYNWMVVADKQDNVLWRCNDMQPHFVKNLEIYLKAVASGNR